jgi:serine/threonine-protein kinase
VSGIIPFSGGTQEELIYQVTRGPIAPLRDYVATLPAGFETVVARCMEREKSKRFGSVAELARALAPYSPQSATPSLERIALLESTGSGTAMISNPLAPLNQGFAGSAILREHAREVQTGPNHAGSQAGWATSGRSARADLAPPTTGDRAARYVLVAIGVLAGVLGGVAYWRYGTQKLGDPRVSATQTAPPETTLPSATAPSGPTVGGTALTQATSAPIPGPSTSAAPSASATTRHGPGGGGIRKPPRQPGSASSQPTGPATTAQPIPTGPEIPETRN